MNLSFLQFPLQVPPWCNGSQSEFEGFSFSKSCGPVFGFSGLNELICPGSLLHSTFASKDWDMKIYAPQTTTNRVCPIRSMTPTACGVPDPSCS
ncbi:unnamed protein product [Fusarium graminearum]|nr:unnamed protein product [Fusarium graminearum]CAG1975766.1 unnamed protein product [Fusarium graminearum]CAG2000357.1 unnamed protein product [Fusarium graminearum]VTO93116.1 unnamed protein product [Fusarium graminearum]